MKKTNFIEEGNFYKGNCHCHTTNSDGKIKPEDIQVAYREKGYDFLMITDHNVHSNFTEFNSEKFILIQGFEGDIGTFHFIFFPTTLDKPFCHLERVPNNHTEGIRSEDATIEYINNYVKNICDRGYAAMINHPYWSSIGTEEIMKIENIFALEVYNYGCAVSENTAESLETWDACLRKGKRLWGMATDDNHNHKGLDNKRADSFGGWINVKAKSLSQEHIIESILEGSFYASTGPEIYDYYVEDGYAFIECSNVEKIYMHSYKNGELLYRFQCEMAMDDKGVTKHRFQLKGDEDFLRIQIYDYFGKVAYTNPIYLKD